MKGVVITGPTGAIGMALIKKSIEEGRRVLAICHRGSRRISQIPQSRYIKVIEASLDEYANLFIDCKPVEEFDTFIHLAWNGTLGNTRNDTYLQTDNIKYILDAVELAHRIGCNTFIGAGSQAEYGRVNEPLRPDTPTFPENGYGIAKLAAGQLSKIRCNQLGIKHIWIRILSVYGPYDGENTMVMSTLIKMLDNKETHFTAGEQIWNYLYSEDAAKMILNLAEKGEHGKIYCLGSLDKRQLKEFIERMYVLTNTNARLGLGDIKYNNNQVMNLNVARECIIDLLVDMTDFDDGIRKTIDYIREEIK